MSSREREDKMKWDLHLLASLGSKDGLGAGKERTSVSRWEEEVGLDLPSLSFCCFWLWSSRNHEAICFCTIHLLQKRDVNAWPHRPPGWTQSPLSFCFLFSNSKVWCLSGQPQFLFLDPGCYTWPSWSSLLMLVPQQQFISKNTVFLNSHQNCIIMSVFY